MRFQTENARERQEFVASLSLAWEPVNEQEKRMLAQDLSNATPILKKADLDDNSWFKVDFETVPELVEGRRIFVKGGKAYVPSKEQMSIVLAGFHERLEKGLEVSNMPSMLICGWSFDACSLPHEPFLAWTKMIG